MKNRGFWQLADPKIWIASTVPMLVGAALAYGNTGKFNFYWFIVALLGIYCIEIGKNAVNEYVDFKSGVDLFVKKDKRTPFSGGKKAIVDGKLTPHDTIIIAVVSLGLGALIGLYIVFFREVSLIWIGLIGILFSIFYSLPPFQFAYKGLGEFIVGLTFGPLITSGMYLVMAQSLNWLVILAGIPIGFLISNILWINQYPDYEADKQGNKRNWVVRLGKKKGLRVYSFLFTGAYISLIIVSYIYRNPIWLLGLAGVPLSIQSVKIAKVNYNNIPRLIQANAKTVLIYQVTGLAMIIGAITNRVFFK